MATLTIPDKGITLTDADAIRDFLAANGIFFEQWEAGCAFANDATQDEILSAYAHTLKPYMAKHGYQTADVISVNADTPNLAELRAKFLHEHTHSEDEVRFFVDGQGYFWFNLSDAQAERDQEQRTREDRQEENGNIRSYNVEALGDSARDVMVFCVQCVAGDLLAVPKGFKHWFDMGEPAFVKTIRIFTDAAGWVPYYTHSGIESRYRTSVASQSH